MRRVFLDVLVVTALMIAGLAVTRNLDGSMSYGFCVLFGVAFATARWTYRRVGAARATS